MIWIWSFVTLALIILVVTASINAISFPRLQYGKPETMPRVSLLVPARNEAGVIRRTVQALLLQDYPDYELVVLDDHSSDGTSQMALQAAAGDERFSLLQGQPLPPGWLGKNWACAQLGQHATGDVLVFIDADVCWTPHTLPALLASMQNQRADVLAVWPTQVTRTWSERLVVPLVMLAVLAYLPEILVRFTSWPAFAAANGQCLAFRRQAYNQMGGHAGVRGEIVEDVALARLARRSGQRLVMTLGEKLVACRMYTGWDQVRDGFAKNILAGHGGVGGLALSVVFHWLVFLGPWAWLILGGLAPLGWGWPWLPLALAALGTGVRALTAAVARQRVGDALLMPVSVVLMSIITVQALVWHWRGGPLWKGRTLIRGQNR